MRALSVLFAAFSAPIMLLNLLGGIVGAIWLICLGMWKPVGLSLAILIVGAHSLAFILAPGLIFAIPAAKAADQGKTGTAFFIGFFSILYTLAVIAVWACLIFKTYSLMGPASAQWPLLLLSYGACTGPWAYMASKEQGAENGIPHSALHVMFLSIGYIIAMSARLFADARFSTCFWIIVVTLIMGQIVMALLAAEENRNSRY
jgi:hypothetical protein